MSYENKLILIKRLKSLTWRLGMFLAVTLVAFVSDNLNLFDIPAAYLPFISLVLSEVTKYLNGK